MVESREVGAPNFLHLFEKNKISDELFLTALTTTRMIIAFL